MDRRIKGILFDLGDTLLDFGQLDVTSLFEAGGHLAYQYLKDLEQPLPPFRRYLKTQLWAIRRNYFLSRITRREFNSVDLILRLAARTGQDLTREHALRLAWLWYEPLSKEATVEEGLPETLRRLRDSGLTLGLVSNTFIPADVLDRHLAQEGLLEFLPVRTYSCDVGYRKPSRRIFRAALDAADLAAGETLFVGDSLRADIKGANRMGIVTVLKDPTDRHARSRIKPHHRIRRLTELPAVVAEYNGDEGDGLPSGEVEK
jgi:putative hydrolase of the HAD superfamily